MIPDENIGLMEAARAIAAGRRVDWAAIESSTGISDSLAALLRELKVVEDIAELHRSLPDPSPSASMISDAAALSSINTATVEATPDVATWGPLRLLERVGEGAFGDVYRAWDPRLDREVALKLLRRRDSRRDSLGSLVIDEGRLLARVRHPNVVTVYGADRVDGRVGLWMEFVRGRTIESILRDHGPFGAQEAALIGLDLCRALSAVHRAGLIHRDIKAQNVMREGGGRIVLMDFGTGLEDLSGRPAELAGTPLYLAPEVFGGAAATVRSDIYSVGVLLYHLATGSYPVTGRTVPEVREAHEKGRRSLLRDERPDLPDRFIQAVERALEFDPPDRYESAGAMEVALARVVSAPEAASAAAVDTAVISSAVESSVRRRVNRPWLAAAAAVAATLTVAAALMPASWRGALLGGHGAAPPAQAGAPAAGFSSSVMVRRVPLPRDYMLIGAPSADGKRFSLTDITGNVALFDLATGQVRRVTNDAVLEGNANQFAEFTAPSADGQMITYAWMALDGKYELRIVDAEGKHPRVLARSGAVDYGIPYEWSRDASQILWILMRPDHSSHLALVSASDGSIRSIKELRGVSPQHASLSPDGEFVVYDYPQHPSDNARDIFIMRSDGSDNHPLIEHPATDTNPVWTPDGKQVLFASDRSGTMDIWSVSVSRGFAEGEPRVVHRSIGRMWLRGLTATGSYFYDLTVGAADVFDAELSAEGVKNPRNLSMAYSGTNISSIWSPDGQRLAYASRRGLVGHVAGSTALVIHDLQTKQQQEFTPAMSGFQVQSWSADGRFILLHGSDTHERSGIYRFDIETGRTMPIVITDSPSNSDGIGRADWMSDGRVLYFDRLRNRLVARSVETRADEVVLDLKQQGIELNGGPNGRAFKLSPNGATLALSVGTQEGNGWTNSLVVKNIAGGPSRELLRQKSPEFVMLQDWTPDGGSLLFTRRSGKPNDPPSLWRISIQGGDPQPLGLAMRAMRDISVRGDGTRITFTSGFPNSELWVMENFLTEK